MATEEETEHDEPDETETEPEDIRQMIRDEIRSVLKNFPGEGSVTDIKKNLPDDDEPLSLRAVESSVRRIVEEAMIPLREAQKKATPKKTAPKQEPERAPEPVATKPTRKLTELLWGPQ